MVMTSCNYYEMDDIETMIDNDLISNEEAGFMIGYLGV